MSLSDAGLGMLPKVVALMPICYLLIISAAHGSPLKPEKMSTSTSLVGNRFCGYAASLKLASQEVTRD